MTENTHTVYLIRHGLTYQNLCREYQGSILNYDVLPESRHLIEQRQKRGASPTIRTLWASPLVRARRTAELYFPGQAMEYMDDLMERDFGEWDGSTHEELLSDPRYLEFYKSRGLTTPPGGESYEVFFGRVERVLERIDSLIKESPYQFPLGIVFHGGPISRITGHLMDEEHPLHRYQALGAGGLKLEMLSDPLRVVSAEEIFTDDIPVEKTSFYIDFERQSAG